MSIDIDTDAYIYIDIDRSPQTRSTSPNQNHRSHTIYETRVLIVLVLGTLGAQPGSRSHSDPLHSRPWALGQIRSLNPQYIPITYHIPERGP